MDHIMDPNDPSAVDRPVLGQRLLDLLQADVGAVVDDDLLLAPREPQVAVFVRHQLVAGIEPARLDGLGGGIELVQYPIMLHGDLIQRRPSVPIGNSVPPSFQISPCTPD